MPVRYFVTNRDVPGVTAPQLQTAVAQRVRDLEQRADRVALGASSSASPTPSPVDDDGVSVIGFQSQSRSRPRARRDDASRVDDVTGADPRVRHLPQLERSHWSVAASGEAARFDVESIASHEIGHLLGLGHSALGETELRPDGGRARARQARGDVSDRVSAPATSRTARSKADDVAGISDIYRDVRVRRRIGQRSAARVTLNGAGVFGAHVTAFNPSTGALVGDVLARPARAASSSPGSTPGVYVVRVEPLDDADLDSFFDDDTPREHQLQGRRTSPSSSPCPPAARARPSRSRCNAK